MQLFTSENHYNCNYGNFLNSSNYFLQSNTFPSYYQNTFVLFQKNFINYLNFTRTLLSNSSLSFFNSNLNYDINFLKSLHLFHDNLNAFGYYKNYVLNCNKGSVVLSSKSYTTSIGHLFFGTVGIRTINVKSWNLAVARQKICFNFAVNYQVCNILNVLWKYSNDSCVSSNNNVYLHHDT